MIHVWYIVEEGAPGLKLNAPLFNGLKDTNALVRGSWGAAPAEGLEAQDGDFVVEKMRMSAWQGTRLENLLAGLGRDTIIITGAWTNMSIEHTSRTGADKGFVMVVPGGRLLDDERRLAQRVDQLRAPERLHRDQLRRRKGGARVGARVRICPAETRLGLQRRDVPLDRVEVDRERRRLELGDVHQERSRTTASISTSNAGKSDWIVVRAGYGSRKNEL